MALAKRLIAALLLTAAAALLLASSALAGDRVGVVTNIEGTATVARLTRPDAQPLQVKDDVFLRDRITSGVRSTITILRGLVDVTRLDATAGPVGPAVKVGALQRVSVLGAGPVSAPTSLSPEAARRLASEFSLVPKEVPAASVEALNASL